MASWNSGYQVWLTQTAALQNAQNIATYCLKHGWEKRAICAICGNAYVESSVNPNMYEYGYSWSQDRGYGLFQWTPRSKLSSWCSKEGLDYKKGESQLGRLTWETKNNVQYYPTRNYPETFTEFRTNKNNKSVEYLTRAFVYNYERPIIASANFEKRIAFAKLCYDKLKFDGVTGGKDNEKPIGQEGSNPIKELITDRDIFPNAENNNFNLNDVTNLINNFITNLEKTLNDVLTVDLYNLSEYQYSNNFISITKQLDNMYKIKPNLDFFTIFEKLTNALSSFSSIDSDVLTGSANEEKPKTTVTTPSPSANANANIKKMTDKAFSYKTGSVRYSMNYPRDMVTSGDCSSFVSHVLNAAGLNVGNGGTPDLYSFARNRGWLVIDGYQKDVENIISQSREGDYILMAKNASFNYGGSSHVVYVYSKNGIRHQTSAGSGYGPVNDKLDTYLRNARDYWAYRFALCRPFK